MSSKMYYRPSVTEFEITSRCPLDCVHCVQHSPNDENSLSTADVKGVLDDLVDAGCHDICITGGEPLLHKDFWSIIDHSVSIGLNTAIYTSGVTVSPKVAAELQNAGVSNVFVTLFGSYSNLHDSLTGRSGSYEKTCSAVRNLVSLGIRVTVHVPIVKRNLTDITAIVELSETLGAQAFHLIRYFPHNLECNASADVLLTTAKELSEAVRSVKEKVGEAGSQIEFIPGNTLPFALLDQPDTSMERCSAGKERCFITASGHVIPCPGFREAELLTKENNLHFRSFKAIWENSKPMLLMRERRIDNLNDPCQSCSDRDECKGGCPAQSYIFFKDVLKADPLCINNSLKNANMLQKEMAKAI
ncbi:MAG: radical SAM protein [Coriobacteriia bacterium]|nr:radical SAM protein [Coriobacteriia bacterium]